jgi:sulfhydrogenase subunit delta
MKRIGLYELTGCAGEMLHILGMEDILLDVLGKVEIAEWLIASSGKRPGRVDIAFVEGSVSTERDLEALKAIRGNSEILVAMGDCAVWGGLQASTTGENPKRLMREVYGTEENYFGFLGEHRGLSEYVKVDYELPGCPIEQDEFVRLLLELVDGVTPCQKDYPVCVECKVREIPCLIVEKNEPCLGPVTVGGCRARCPFYGTPCIGCRGPVRDEANVAGEIAALRERGWSDAEIVKRLELFAKRYPAISSLIGGGGK